MMNMRSLGTLDVNQTPVFRAALRSRERLRRNRRQRRRRRRRWYGADVVLANESRWDCRGS